MKNKSIPERSMYTTMAVDIISKHTPGEVIAYSEFQEKMGLDPQSHGRQYVHSARRILLNDEGIVTKAIIRQGIKILTPEQISTESSDYNLKHFRRHVKKSLKELDTVSGDDFVAMPLDARCSHNLAKSMLGVSLHMTNRKQVNLVKANILKNPRVLGFRETLELFEG